MGDHPLPGTPLSTMFMTKRRASTIDTQWAKPPFDNKKGNVILRSSDNVHFRLYKGTLANASPIFDNLFTHGQSPAPSIAGLGVGGEVMDKVPFIGVDERSAVLDRGLGADDWGPDCHCRRDQERAQRAVPTLLYGFLLGSEHLVCVVLGCQISIPCQRRG